MHVRRVWAPCRAAPARKGLYVLPAVESLEEPSASLKQMSPAAADYVPSVGQDQSNFAAKDAPFVCHPFPVSSHFLDFTF
jgi:hypothetical protein